MNNYKEGYREKYYDELKTKIFSKGHYINDKYEGYWEYFYYNGELNWKGNFLNNREIGYWEHYYEDGKVWEKFFYIL